MSLLTNLISYWKLDEASGTRFDSQSTNDLTDNNGVTSATGIINDGASFSRASSQSLSKSSPSSIDFGHTDFTWSAWVKFTSFSGAGGNTVVKTDNSGQRSFFIVNVGDTDDRQFRARIDDIGGSTVGITDGIRRSTGTWYFVVVWHDATNNVLGLSVNNSAVSTGTGGTVPRTGVNNLAIGAGEGFQDGLIDEVGVWSRVLTSTEITNLYNSGAGLAYGSFGGGGNTYNETMSGGAYANGIALFNKVTTPQVSSGGLCGASANCSVLYSPGASGGVWCNGSGIGANTFNEVMSGGAYANGSGVLVVRYSPQASSGGLCGATANCSVLYSPTVSGGVWTNGLAITTTTYSAVVSGGAMCNSQAGVSVVCSPSVSGGVWCSGYASVPSPTVTVGVARWGFVVSAV